MPTDQGPMQGAGGGGDRATLLRDLARAKAAFQLRAIAAVVNARPTPDNPS